MTKEGGEALAYAQARFDEQRSELEQKLNGLSAELTSLQREVDNQKGALALQADELQICGQACKTNSLAMPA
jgi:ABC-type phosphate transport system auxiliary subunit